MNNLKRNYNIDDSFDYLFKFVILGDSGVGKSNILTRFVHDHFNIESNSTIGVEFYTKILNYNDKKIKIQFWDTAGQERYKSITSSYYKGAHGILLVYDITLFKSYEHVNNWIDEIYANVGVNTPIILIGNKSDLENKRVVTKENAQMLANKYGLTFIETSAMIDTNINEAIDEIVGKVYKLNKHCVQKNQNVKIFIDKPSIKPRKVSKPFCFLL